jgi:ribonuclease HI
MMICSGIGKFWKSEWGNRNVFLNDRYNMSTSGIQNLLIPVAILRECMKADCEENAKTCCDTLYRSLTQKKKGVNNAPKRQRRIDPSIINVDGFKIFFDGSYTRTPLNSGFGYCILKNEVEVGAGAGFQPGLTINESEFMGLISALEKAVESGIRDVTVFGDSATVIGTAIRGFHRAPSLARFSIRLRELLYHFDTLNIEYIPRELNKRADALAYTACMAPTKIHEVVNDPSSSRPTPESNLIPIQDCGFVQYDFDTLFPVHPKLNQIPGNDSFSYIYFGTTQLDSEGNSNQQVLRTYNIRSNFEEIDLDEYHEAFGTPPLVFRWDSDSDPTSDFEL